MGLIIAGIKPFIPTITFGITLSFFTLPIILGTNFTIWQTSVHPKLQGRVLSLFYTIAGLGLSLGNLSASPLADRLLEPMLSHDGLLANTVGRLLETGEGRGIGFLIVMAGLFVVFTSLSFYTYFAFKQIGGELLDIDEEILENKTIDTLDYEPGKLRN